MILTYGSVHEYMRAVGPETITGVQRGENWDAGVSPQDACTRAIMGDPTIVSQFDATIASVTAGIETTQRPGYVVDWYGSRVDMGRYVAGLPNCMRRRARRATDTRHVSVYVSLVCSAGIRADMMLKRGSAILGFLAVLQSQNIGVDLYLVADMQGARARRTGREDQSGITLDMVLDGDCTQVIRVESRPLDLSQTGFVIAHPAFTRHITYTFGKRYGFHGSWSATFDRSGGHSDPLAYSKAMAAKLGLNETDVFIPPAHSGDEIVRDPQAWILARVTQCLGTRLVA